MPSYTNELILLASKHFKERAIAGPFRDILACELVLHDFDTDQFGTFTGEVERKGTPYATCKLKASKAAEMFNYQLAVANEGSFGPHPSMPFLASAHEVMLLIDLENELVISEQILTDKTNYNMLVISKGDDIEDFLTKVKFSSHALTLQKNSDKEVIGKGITDKKLLLNLLEFGFSKDEKLLIGTDMRAMFNPTRMQVLRELAIKLANRIATKCISCDTPGFGLKTTRGSLPCRICKSPTSFFLEEVYGCVKCRHEEYRPRPDGLRVAEPTYCNYCNP